MNSATVNCAPGARRLLTCLLLSLTMVGLLGTSASAHYTIITPPGPPLPGFGAPLPPSTHPGKEYSQLADVNFNTATFDGGQVVLWDGTPLGAPGNINGFDYDHFDSTITTLGEVDALANIRDHLFLPLRSNGTPLLFSSTTYGGIRYEEAGAVGATGIWAGSGVESAPLGDVNGHIGVGDLDGLEVFGPEPFGSPPGMFDDGATAPPDVFVTGSEAGAAEADANMFSYFMDFNPAAGTYSVGSYKTLPAYPAVGPVENFVAGYGSVSGYVPQTHVIRALVSLGFDGVALDPLDVDLDALMVNDAGGLVDAFGLDPVTGAGSGVLHDHWGDVGDHILFSVVAMAPPDDPIGALRPDGGEIMEMVWAAPGAPPPLSGAWTTVLDAAAMPITDGATGAVLWTKFLDHGGHLWDTAFAVRGLYGPGGFFVDALEDVNALEAAAVAFVPEPSTAALALLAGCFGLIGRARRRRTVGA